MTTHKRAKSNTLSPAQHLCVDLLAGGATFIAAAEALQVRRETVSSWYHHNWVFRAALNQRRQELFSEHTDRLRALLPKALDVIERALSSEEPRDRQKAAETILRLALSGVSLGAQVSALKTSAEALEDDEFFGSVRSALQTWSPPDVSQLEGTSDDETEDEGLLD